jgi:hypothetical protein
MLTVYKLLPEHGGRIKQESLSYHFRKTLMFRNTPLLTICNAYNIVAVKIQNLILLYHFLNI